MTIPFLDIFKKLSGRFQSDQTTVAPPEARSVTPAPSKTASERLSKTVMPNTTRSTSSDFFKAAGDSAPNVRAVSSRALPPTVALALQATVERAISLELSDLVGGIPASFLKPAESFDAGQTILLKASEIEQGMSDGKPAVSLFSIYEQMPDIFLRTVRPDDATQVAVPHAKVLDQLRKMQVRDDQETESAVPQVDTPILKVTIEDTQRFGTKLATVQTSSHPRVKVEPATAKAFSKAEPEVAVSEKLTPSAPAGIPLNLTTPPKVTPRPSAPDPVTPTRIPFKLPPKGTGEPASERVPASSGSSVPPPVPVSTSATRIPFKMTPPSDDLKPKFQIVPGVTAAETAEKKAPPSAVPTGAKISLGLRAVVQNMPSFQLHRSAESVDSAARVELPLALVESQLASGRIAIPVKLFQEALSAQYKELLVIDAAESPVLLPLQEVLKNLSPDLMRMRDDQVTEEVAEGFETPFSIKAAEDAKRFTEEQEAEAAAQVKATVAAKTTEAKQPEAVKPVESKPLEAAKAPEPKQLETPKLAETKPEPKAVAVKLPEIPKPAEAKVPAKPVEAKQVEPVKTPEVPKAVIPKPEAKAPEMAKASVVPKAPEVLKAPEVPQPVVPKPEAKAPVIISKPAPIAEVPPLRVAAPQSVPSAKPISEAKLPAVETKPVAKVEAPTEPKPAPAAEIKIQPELKLRLTPPNEPAPKPAPVVEKPAVAKPAEKPDVNTSAKAVVERINTLPGVAGSVVTFEDGLNLAGNLPNEVQLGGLCAMAPSILQKVNRHTVDTKFGPLLSMTLAWNEGQLSFFMTGTVCLAVLHSQPVLPGETHYQLAAIARELSRIYAKPGEKHVDH